MQGRSRPFAIPAVRPRTAVFSDCLTSPPSTPSTFRRLLGFAAAHRRAARVVDRARARRAGLRARDPELHRARDRRRHPAARPLEPVALGLADHRRGPHQRRAHGRAAPDRRPPLAERRVRPAAVDVHAPAGHVVRLLRQAPDRPAALARDERRQRRAHVPRLRPRLHHAVRRVADRRLGAARDHELAARADHVRAAAADRDRGDALLAPLAPRAARHPAAHRRRHDAGRGVDRRRARRQGLRAGGRRDRSASPAHRARLRARARLARASRRATARCSTCCRSSPSR